MKLMTEVTRTRSRNVALLPRIKKVFPKVGTSLYFPKLVFLVAQQVVGKSDDDYTYIFQEDRERKELSLSLQKLLTRQRDGFQLELSIKWNDENGYEMHFTRKS